MSNRLLSLLMGFCLGLVVMYFAHKNKTRPTENQVKVQSVIDSITIENKVIAERRYQDSLRTAARLSANSKSIQKLENEIEKISFRHYSDPQLDSLVNVLYPDSLRPGFNVHADTLAGGSID